MKYLLDTNIISELIKDNPNENVVSFIKSISEDAFVLSVVTVGEIKFGIENSKSEAKKEELKNWLYNHLLQRFENKIIDIEGVLEISCQSDRILNSKGQTDERGVQF